MKNTVLVVEDDLLIAMDLKETLEVLGWGVIGPAHSVDHALGILARESPSVALLDINLGRELVTPVAEALSEIGVPFVFASATVDLGMLGHRIYNGRVNIGKSVHPQILADALATALGSRA